MGLDVTLQRPRDTSGTGPDQSGSFAEERLLLALEAAQMGTWEWDISTGKVHWSASLERLHGIPDGSFDGTFEGYQRDIHPEDRQRVLETIARSARGENHQLEYRIIRPDGQVRWLEAHGRLIRDSRGRPERLLGVCRDVTDRRQDDLRRSFIGQATRQLALMLAPGEALSAVARLAVPHIADWCAVDLLAPDGRLERMGVAHVDPAKVELARELYRRYPPHPDAPTGIPNVLRTGVSELYPVIPDEMLEAAVQDEAELDIIRSLGLYSSMIVPMRVHDRVIGAISFVTARDTGKVLGPADLALAEELGHCAAIAVSNARLYETAQREARAREEMVAVVSHDLRNPLSVVMMRVQSLDRRLRDTDARTRRDLEAIQRNGSRMERLLRDLLDAATIEAGRFRVEMASHDLPMLVASAMETIQPQALSRHLQLSTHVSKDVGAILCDRERVLQVLGNLLGNAAKFTPEGGRIELSCERLAEEVRFAVIDGGPGVPDEHRRRLFERYWKSGDGNRTGIGLGLYIARGLVEAHGGRIWLDATGPEGSTFVFTLPCREEPPSDT